MTSSDGSPDVPALLAEIDRLTAKVESMTRLVREWADPLNSHTAALLLALTARP